MPGLFQASLWGPPPLLEPPTRAGLAGSSVSPLALPTLLVPLAMVEPLPLPVLSPRAGLADRSASTPAVRPASIRGSASCAPLPTAPLTPLTTPPSPASLEPSGLLLPLPPTSSRAGLVVGFASPSDSSPASVQSSASCSSPPNAPLPPPASPTSPKPSTSPTHSLRMGLADPCFSQPGLRPVGPETSASQSARPLLPPSASLSARLDGGSPSPSTLGLLRRGCETPACERPASPLGTPLPRPPPPPLPAALRLRRTHIFAKRSRAASLSSSVCRSRPSPPLLPRVPRPLPSRLSEPPRCIFPPGRPLPLLAPLPPRSLSGPSSLAPTLSARQPSSHSCCPAGLLSLRDACPRAPFFFDEPPSVEAEGALLSPLSRREELLPT